MQRGAAGTIGEKLGELRESIGIAEGDDLLSLDLSPARVL
jgi:hypothetical protein